MKTWAVINQKGGVGKTTTTISLAGHLCASPGRQLLVDLDPHGSLTSYLGYDPDNIETGIFKLFSSPTTSQAEIARMLLPTSLPNTWLFAASSALAKVDRQVSTSTGKGLVVAQAIRSVTDKFDYCIVDSPPMLGTLMINALAACDQLLIPAQTDYLSINGLQRMVHTLGMVAKSLAYKTPYLIIPTMFDKRTRASIDALQKMKATYQSRVWPSVIPIDTRFRDASNAGVPLSSYSPGSRGSQAYQALLEYILGQADQEQLDDNQQLRGNATEKTVVRVIPALAGIL